ncbi:hypothetical protein [Luteibaculum oceani]|uniref:Uncharacterized protein n=1 Tax=Luteibaculum oceani TaxID=1294296 RepID=A0A5C6V8H0_9FLAO|nr:hypothetical protein [Luteibaculum oceani]TXC81672.1 hypothetical protein FRX97_03920 [Luteibaculum oceani]
MSASIDHNNISKKKPFFPVSDRLERYLRDYQRKCKLPVEYDDLLHYSQSFPLTDDNGVDTLWETVMYDPSTQEELNIGLTAIYTLLKTDGDDRVKRHLYVSRIDYCCFGNSNPFRIRIVNKFNDNYDYFYIKKVDASRIYGLELEHLLSPDRINFLVGDNSLIEEHIAGIPGDVFIQNYLHSPQINRVRVAKEFVKFNERSFVRLLGDMRSYNYVVNITPDFDNEQYRIRAIDFDQQCYEGRRTMYLPQYFKENNPVVDFCVELINEETARQYQYEERTLIARRLISYRYQIKALIDCMRKDHISKQEKVDQLREELANHHRDPKFLKCKNMGDLLRRNLYKTLAKTL